MAQNDIQQRLFGDIRLAFGLLTRLPLPGAPDIERGASAAWAWPVVGLVVASLGSCAIWLTSGLPSGVSAAIALGVMIMTTGAMHEDGLADTADGLWGGWDRDRRLEIMKDSHIGAYGVIALIVSLLARWSLLASLIASGWVWAPLVAAATLSRAPMVLIMAVMDPARPSGLAGQVGQPPLHTAWIAAGIGVVVAVAVCGFGATWAIIAAFLVAAALAGVAQAKIGGQTGDILGASQQVSEIAALALLTATLT